MKSRLREIPSLMSLAEFFLVFREFKKLTSICLETEEETRDCFPTKKAQLSEYQ